MSHHLPDTLTHTLSSHLALGKSRLQTLSWLIIGLINARTVIGPILTGLDKPVKLTTTTATVSDVLNMAVMAACRVG